MKNQKINKLALQNLINLLEVAPDEALVYAQTLNKEDDREGRLAAEAGFLIGVIRQAKRALEEVVVDFK